MNENNNSNIKFKNEEDFWINYIPKDIEKSSFCNSTLENIKYKSEKSEIQFYLSEDISHKIMRICNESEYGIFMLLVLGVNCLLARYTGNKRVVVGIPKTKSHSNTNYFSPNLSLLKTEINEENTFKQTLLQVKDMINKVNKMESLRIEEIQRLVGIENFEDITNLFDTIVLLKSIHSKDSIKGINVSTVFSFDIVDRKIMCSLQYDKSGLDEEKVLKLKTHLINFYNTVTSNPKIKLSEIEILSYEEKKEILFNGYGKQINYEKSQTLHSLFEKQVEKTPDRIAVKFNDKELTYRQLNNNANKLAKELRDKGVINGTVVGLLVERSVEMIIGVLAIIKAGGAYLPINTKNPTNRIEYMLKDSKTKILMSCDELVDNFNFSGKRVIIKCKEEMDESNLVNINKSEDLAYIIYTSGTTGNPKGVMISHKNVINLVAGLSENIYKLHGEYLNVACLAPYYFDASAQQFFASLLLGHKLIIVPENVRSDGNLLLKFYSENSINISDGTPAHINMITNAQVFNEIGVNVEHFIIGGEQLQYNLVNNFLEKVSNKNIYITNVYGPTECCVDCTSFLISKSTIKELNNIPIGKAMPNQIVYVLDRNMNIVPNDVFGEIYISGEGVGLGYLDRDNLNDDRFIKDPFIPGLTMYRTGDIGKWNRDGYLQYSGRVDSQVKIRGYRIELGEIENVLLSYNNVDEKQSSDEIRICSKCLMNSSYPYISFNDSGICNYCESYDTHKIELAQYFKEINDFKAVMEVAKHKNRSKYDCLLLYSGGKDSSYVLYKLVEMGYSVLAFTFDNGYISASAFDNIRKITQSLNVDSVIYSTDKMKEIFAESLRNDSTVCSGCFKALTSISTKVALDKGINVIITGLSRGQIMDTKLQHLYEEGIFDVEDIEQKLLLFRKFYHSVNDKTHQLLNIDFENIDAFDSLYFIDFFRYENCSSEEILNYLKQKDEFWSIPKDTGLCSTNCLINDVGIYIHLKNKGYHNYLVPLSWSYRLGQVFKNNAASELETTFDVDKINRILDEIGYTEEVNETKLIKEAVVVDNVDELGNKYLSVYFVSNKKIMISNLRNYLAKMLPEYEIPSYYVQVNSIPKTANGKVDKRNLPNARLNAIVETKYQPPNNEVERGLVKIWEEILKVNKIGINDNFFELGGHSLSAMLLIAKIIEQFNVNVSLSDVVNTVTIEKLAELIMNKEANAGISISKVMEHAYYPVSSNQKSMYILDTLYPESTRYNVPTVQLIKGKLDINRFENSFKELIRRHESLRTSFELINNEIVQIVSSKIDFKLQYIAAEYKSINKVIDEFIKPFDLMKAPLIRVGLIKINENEHMFIFDIHHIISDAITLNILINDFARLYSGSKLPELKLQYKDYSSWQNLFLESDVLKRQKKFWLDNFKDYNFSSYLPIDYTDSFSKNNLDNVVRFDIVKNLKTELEQFAISTNTTLFMVLLTAYNILLYRYSNRNDIVIGAPIAGRHYPDLNQIAGIFINTLALRNFPNGNKKIKEFLYEVRKNSLKAFENQDYPFEELVDALNIRPEMNRNPIFDAMFVLQTVDYRTVKVDGLEFIPYEVYGNTSIIDLTLEGEKYEDELKMHFQFNEKLFRRETIENLAYNYLRILRCMIKEDILISEIELSNL